MDICGAIAGRRLVRFFYDGHHRLVVPAAFGTHKTTGNHLLRAYQVGGTDTTRQIPCWSLFEVGLMIGAEAMDERFDADPPDYKRGDKALNVRCQL